MKEEDKKGLEQELKPLLKKIVSMGHWWIWW